jgi:hypothetical protein
MRSMIRLATLLAMIATVGCAPAMANVPVDCVTDTECEGGLR